MSCKVALDSDKLPRSREDATRACVEDILLTEKLRAKESRNSEILTGCIVNWDEKNIFDTMIEEVVVPFCVSCLNNYIQYVQAYRFIENK